MTELTGKLRFVKQRVPGDKAGQSRTALILQQEWRNPGSETSYWMDVPQYDFDEPRKMILIDGYPRRFRVECQDLAEIMIKHAITSVDKLGSDPDLTEAITLMQQAANRVGDVIDKRLEAEDDKKS